MDKEITSSMLADEILSRDEELRWILDRENRIRQETSSQLKRSLKKNQKKESCDFNINLQGYGEI